MPRGAPSTQYEVDRWLNFAASHSSSPKSSVYADWRQSASTLTPIFGPWTTTPRCRSSIFAARVTSRLSALIENSLVNLPVTSGVRFIQTMSGAESGGFQYRGMKALIPPSRSTRSCARGRSRTRGAKCSACPCGRHTCLQISRHTWTACSKSKCMSKKNDRVWTLRTLWYFAKRSPRGALSGVASASRDPLTLGGATSRR